MKIRNGFVSNSSSSSFILNDKNINAEQFVNIISDIWDQLDGKNEGIDRVKKISKFIDIKSMDIEKAKETINKMYENESWGGDGYVDWDKKRGPTYLEEALDCDVFGTSQENEIPYEVLDELKRKFGKKLIIHHLG